MCGNKFRISSRVYANNQVVPIRENIQFPDVQSVAHKGTCSEMGASVAFV